MPRAAHDHDGGLPNAPAVPGQGGPRSEPTRRAILEAAREAFAARGYEQTTIRAVAARAEIDPSMVMRYFGSKAGLFAAASTTHLEPPDLRSAPAQARGELLVRHFVERWEQQPGNSTLVMLLRTAITNDAVAQQLQAIFTDLIATPIAEIAERDAARCASLIGAELLGLALCRYLLHLQPIASASLAELIEGIAPAVQLHLDDSSQ
jgi:AcrR family transcriptional regulator